MQPNALANSTFTKSRTLSTLRIVLASWSAMFAERFAYGGLLGYCLTWIALPLFQLLTVAMIFGQQHPELLNYATVTLAANTSIFTTIYFVGEILDRERLRGTLIGLFLAPCSRLSWLTGFAFVGVFESGISAAIAILCAWLFLGVQYDPNWLSLLLILALFFISLWGLGMIFSAIGLAIKKANQFSNLVSPILLLLGGIYFPANLLPEPLRFLAHCLPLSYGMQALADAALHQATPTALAPQLWALAGFAVVLPLAGLVAFNWIERKVRLRGELDLY